MKKIVHKIKELTAAKKIRLAVALLLTAAMMVAVPTYAWFSQQQKAAEMYKVQYPNSLYINAAHREDQIFFDLDAVNAFEAIGTVLVLGIVPFCFLDF